MDNQDEHKTTTVSRRRLLQKLGGAAVAGAGLAAVAARPASAAAGEAVLQGGTEVQNNAGTATTNLVSSAATPTLSVKNTDGGSQTVSTAAIVGDGNSGPGGSFRSTKNHAVFALSPLGSGNTFPTIQANNSAMGPAIDATSGTATNPSTVVAISAYGTGSALRVTTNNTANPLPAVRAEHLGNANGGFFKSDGNDALFAETTNPANANAGVHGKTAGTGAAVLGEATGTGVGLRAQGGRAPLLLDPGATAGAPTTGTHSRGELYVGSGGALFMCVAPGPPGTWIRVGLNPLTPTRIVDTRVGAGPPANPLNVYAGQTLGPASTKVIQVAGLIGPAGSQQTVVPIQASAVVANVTVTNPSAGSFLTVYPTGETKPNASILNWVAGQTVPNMVTVKLGTTGAISIYNESGTADVIVDLAGFYS